jgi:nucleoside 2-deoxyribosyltransferase
MKKVFISGGITLEPNAEEKFGRAEKMLLKQGCSVLNPFALNDAMKPIEDFLHQDFMEVTLSMLSISDAVYMLKGWENSKGARIEYDYAIQTRKEIIFESEDTE